MSDDDSSDLARRIEELGRRSELDGVAPLLNQLGEQIQRVTDWLTNHGPGAQVSSKDEPDTTDQG